MSQAPPAAARNPALVVARASDALVERRGAGEQGVGRGRAPVVGQRPELGVHPGDVTRRRRVGATGQSADQRLPLGDERGAPEVEAVGGLTTPLAVASHKCVVHGGCATEVADAPAAGGNAPGRDRQGLGVREVTGHGHVEQGRRATGVVDPTAVMLGSVARDRVVGQVGGRVWPRFNAAPERVGEIAFDRGVGQGQGTRGDEDAAAGAGGSEVGWTDRVASLDRDPGDRHRRGAGSVDLEHAIDALGVDDRRPATAMTNRHRRAQVEVSGRVALFTGAGDRQVVGPGGNRDLVACRCPLCIPAPAGPSRGWPPRSPRATSMRRDWS